MKAFLRAIDRAEARRRKAAIFDRAALRLKKPDFHKYLRDLDG